MSVISKWLLAALLSLNSLIAAVFGPSHGAPPHASEAAQIPTTTVSLTSTNPPMPSESSADGTWIIVDTTPDQMVPSDCGPGFSVRAGTAFYGDVEVQGADVSTFSIYSHEQDACHVFGRDNNHVYMFSIDTTNPTSTNAIYEISGADPQTFYPFYDVNGPTCYAKDSHHVYAVPDYGYTAGLSEPPMILRNADPATFHEQLDSAGQFHGYARDAYSQFTPWDCSG